MLNLEKQRYLLYVMLYKPKATKYTYGYATGGWVGAPLAKRIFTRIITHLGAETKTDYAK